MNSDVGPDDPERRAFVEQYFAAEVAIQLADALERSGMTQAELAKSLGVSEARISQMLNATGNPTAKTIARVFDALGYKAIFVACRRC